MAELLDDNIKTQVKEVFQDLKNPVEIAFFGDSQDGCEYCDQTNELASQVASLREDLLTFHAYDLHTDHEQAAKYKVDKAPGIVLLGKNGSESIDYGIRFSGIPAGHEFTSLINDILVVSSGDSGLTPQTREALAKLDKPVHLQVFVTPSCPYCPRAVVLAHQLALESPYIEAEMVESMEFAELAEKFNVSGVPHTIINDGKGEVVGAVPEAHLLEKILQALA
ncbi:MAG: protein disulfide oxidoreductase [Bellilinea sp.]